MNQKKMHMQYRQSSYRKKRIKTLIIIVAVALAALFVLFLLMGNAFRDKLDEPPDTESAETSDSTAADTHPVPDAINGSFISLEAEGSFSSKLQAVSRGGAEAFGIGMTASDGKLLYRSDLAVKLGHQSSADASLRLSDMSTALSRYDLPSSAIFTFDTLSVEDELERSALLSYNASLVAEAAKSGFDDILIVFPEMTEDNIDEVLFLASQLDALAPDAVIGIAIPSALLTSENASEIAAALWASYDFLAADLTALSEEEDPIAMAGSVCSQIQYFLHRYNIRVIIPSMEDENVMAEILELMDDYSVKNKQIIE